MVWRSTQLLNQPECTVCISPDSCNWELSHRCQSLSLLVIPETALGHRTREKGWGAPSSPHFSVALFPLAGGRKLFDVRLRKAIMTDWLKIFYYIMCFVMMYLLYPWPDLQKCGWSSYWGRAPVNEVTIWFSFGISFVPDQVWAPEPMHLFKTVKGTFCSVPLGNGWRCMRGSALQEKHSSSSYFLRSHTLA